MNLKKLQIFYFAYKFNYLLWIGNIEDFKAIIFAFGFVHSLIQLTETVADQVFQRPNVIFILADDLVRVKIKFNYVNMLCDIYYYVTMSCTYRAGMMLDFMGRYVTK